MQSSGQLTIDCPAGQSDTGAGFDEVFASLHLRKFFPQDKEGRNCSPTISDWLLMIYTTISISQLSQSFLFCDVLQCAMGEASSVPTTRLLWDNHSALCKAVQFRVDQYGCCSIEHRDSILIFYPHLHFPLNGLFMIRNIIRKCAAKCEMTLLDALSPILPTSNSKWMLKKRGGQCCLFSTQTLCKQIRMNAQ